MFLAQNRLACALDQEDHFRDFIHIDSKKAPSYKKAMAETKKNPNPGPSKRSGAGKRAAAITIKRLEALQEISFLLNSTLELREVLERALTSTEKLLSAEASSIFLLDPVTEELLFYALTGVKKSLLEGQRIPKGRGVAGWVVENRQLLLVPDASKDPRFFSRVDEESGFLTHNLVCIPLITKNRALGALEVVNLKDDGHFSQEDIPFLTTLGNHLATALDNALLYKELAEAHESLKTLDQTKSHFISLASHELRTPLALIQSFHELLKSEMIGPLQPQQKEALDAMEKSLRWLNRIVADATNVAYLDREEKPLSLESFDLAVLVRETIAQLAPLFDRRRQESSTEGADGEVIVRGDSDQLRHVLQNLLLNAIRFTPDEGRIKITLEAKEFEVRVGVSDNGIGIFQEEQGRIFEKFAHAQKATTHSSGTIEFRTAGLGLGLAIAKRIVEMHQGRIWVESQVGQGSTFHFTLPR